MSTLLLTIGKSLLTEAFIKKVTIKVLKWLVTKTDNKLDDEIVDAVATALKEK